MIVENYNNYDCGKWDYHINKKNIYVLNSLKGISQHIHHGNKHFILLN